MSTPPQIAIIILAAGASTRLGAPKQLLRYKSQPLLRFICEIALQSKAHSVYVVLGSQSALIKEKVADMSLTIIENSNWLRGISTSIQTGIQALPETVDAALMLSCDQPEVTPTLLDHIIETYITNRIKIIACRYGNTIGIPALYDRSIFPELCALKGDHGAKSLILAHRDTMITVDFPLGVYDIDTQDDLTEYNQ
jgi:molybdenum cofactor cytidylyltransferase